MDVLHERERIKQQILIVDDSRTSRRMLRNILVENGHEVIGEAENGQIGFEKYIELKPDIVTLDITMPVWTVLVHWRKSLLMMKMHTQ